MEQLSFVSQLVEIDKSLRSETDETPKPQWVSEIKVPKKVAEIEKSILKCDKEMETMLQKKNKEKESREKLLKYSALLYENGKPLEIAIQRSLELLGYSVENFRESDLK